jgi:hypothetical protein
MGMISDAPEQYLSNLVSQSISEITFRSKSVSECSRFQIHVYGRQDRFVPGEGYSRNASFALN